MNELPSQVLGLILGHLNVRDWLSACRVNRSWRDEGLHIDQLKTRGWPSYQSLRRSHHMICRYCHKKKAKIRHTTGVRECQSCRCAPGRQLVTRTTAIKQLKIKPADLDGLLAYVCVNPHFSKHCMRLYRVGELQPFISHQL